MKKIFIASDHAGFEIKNRLVERFSQLLEDLGTNSNESVDYPDFAHSLVNSINNNPDSKGILICGTGIGMSIVANRNPKIRAGLCKDIDTAMLTRAHNNANVLCLGARVTDSDFIEAIVDTFLTTQFEGGRHEKRIGKFSVL